MVKEVVSQSSSHSRSDVYVEFDLASSLKLRQAEFHRSPRRVNNSDDKSRKGNLKFETREKELTSPF